MKSLTLLTLLFSVASCSTPVTTPPFGVAAENAWFLEQDTSNHLAVPLYCMSDVKDGKANPKCYKAKTIRQ
jgi:hypothetical protein